MVQSLMNPMPTNTSIAHGSQNLTFVESMRLTGSHHQCTAHLPAMSRTAGSSQSCTKHQEPC